MSALERGQVISLWMAIVIVIVIVITVTIDIVIIELHPHSQVTKALTALVDGCPNFLAGSSPSIADLLALSLAVSNKIGKSP